MENHPKFYPSASRSSSRTPLYKPKRNPEDFIVRENIKLDGKKGEYLYVEMTKTNLNTMDVLKDLAYKLNIPLRFIGFAGNKDKRAITTQYLSIFQGKPEYINQIKIEGVKLKPLHFGSKPLYLGALAGNHFKIKIDPTLHPVKITKVANYYGEQRFSENNKDVGKAILKQEYEEACKLINNDQGNFYLKKNPEDFIGALKTTINLDLLSLYVNAFQSHLWNEVAKQFLTDNFQSAVSYDGLLFVQNPKINIEIPLITFDTFIKQKNLRTYYNNILRKENVSQEDYDMIDFPELVQDTSSRPLFIDVKNLKYTEFPNKENKEVKDHFIEFDLPKGSFATIVIKHLEAMQNLPSKTSLRQHALARHSEKN